MSRNEDLSQFDTEESFPITKFDSFPISAEVQNNHLLVEKSDGAVTDLGDFRLASAVYIVGAYINPAGRAVMVFSDGNEAVLGQVTNNKTYQVTMDGIGLFTGNDKSELQFAQIQTNFPMSFDGKTFAFSPANDLRLDRYVRFDHLSPAPAGRAYTSWTPIPINASVNNLGVPISGNLFILTAGTYYVKIIAQHFRNGGGVAALVSASTNLPITREASSASLSDGSSTQCLISQVVEVSADSQVYFGFKTSSPHAQTYGLGLGLTLDIGTTYDIYNSVEIWRLND